MKAINPDSVVKPASSYAQAVVHSAAAERIVISGQLGLRPDGTLEDGLEAQMVRAWSNVFAIMGLRALYFLLAGIMDMFRYLTYGLSGVLCFIGVKMILAVWPGWHIWPVSSRVIVALLLGTSILASIVAGRRDRANHASEEA